MTPPEVGHLKVQIIKPITKNLKIKDYKLKITFSKDTKFLASLLPALLHLSQILSLFEQGSIWASVYMNKEVTYIA